jgi:excisionase family DNA binding protein
MVGMDRMPEEVRRQALSPVEAARAMGLGERTVRDLCRDGQLRHVRVGARIVIPTKAIDEFLESRSTVA